MNDYSISQMALIIGMISAMVIGAIVNSLLIIIPVATLYASGYIGGYYYAKS